MKITNYLKAALLIAAAAAPSAHAQQTSDDDIDLLQARLAKARAELAVADAALAARIARASAQPTPASEPAATALHDPVAVVQIPAVPKYDPMRLKVAMQFPANVKTIQQASQYLLETVNYKLTLNPLSPEESKQILSRPLMAQDKDGSLRTIEDGLLLISGEDTVLIVDRVNKLISFEIQKKK